MATDSDAKAPRASVQIVDVWNMGILSDRQIGTRAGSTGPRRRRQAGVALGGAWESPARTARQGIAAAPAWDTADTETRARRKPGTSGASSAGSPGAAARQNAQQVFACWSPPR